MQELATCILHLANITLLHDPYLMNRKLPIQTQILTKYLQNSKIGHTIFYHQSVASTMTLAHQLAQQATTRSGTLVLAEHQSAGRGRLQRQWETPANLALLMSLILKPTDLPSIPTFLPIIAGLAVQNTIQNRIMTQEAQSAQSCGLKWPNDILVGKAGPERSQARKVGGILIETSYQQGEMQYAIIGMGINVNQSIDQLPTLSAPAPQAASLYQTFGKVFDRTALLIELCQTWEQLVTQAKANQLAELFAQWQSRLWTLGQRVSVWKEKEVLLEGLAEGCTFTGDLIVRDDQGQTHTIQAGDVSIRS